MQPGGPPGAVIYLSLVYRRLWITLKDAIKRQTIKTKTGERNELQKRTILHRLSGDAVVVCGGGLHELKFLADNNSY